MYIVIGANHSRHATQYYMAYYNRSIQYKSFSFFFQTYIRTHKQILLKSHLGLSPYWRQYSDFVKKNTRQVDEINSLTLPTKLHCLFEPFDLETDIFYRVCQFLNSRVR
jgi:hypothetical protein